MVWFRILFLLFWVRAEYQFADAKIVEKAYSFSDTFYQAASSTEKQNANQQDSTLANEYLKQSRSYWGKDNKKAIEWAQKSLSVSEKAGFKKGVGNALNSLAAIYSINGDYPRAFPLYEKALTIREKTEDLQGMSATLNNMANLYSHQGKPAEAIQYYLKALKIDEKLGDAAAISMDYGNMASVYFYQKEYVEALKMYESALNTEMKMGRTDQIASIYLNLGKVNGSLGQTKKAEEHLNKALLLYERIEDKNGLGNVLQALGWHYFSLKKFNTSIEYQTKALGYFEELNSQKGMKTSFNNLGYSYFYLGDLQKAKGALTKSLEISKQLRIIQDMANDYQGLALVDSAAGNFKEALINQKMAVLYRDSSLNRENTRRITQQRMQFDFDKKETAMRFEKMLTDQQLETQILISQKQKQEIILKEQSVLLANKEKDLAQTNTLRIHAQKQIREKQLKLSEKEKAFQKAALKHSEANLRVQTIIRNAIGAGLLVVLVGAFVVIRQRNRIAKEKKRSDQLVVEKEMLMKEIHHRVKNNLEVISSLLELQSNAMEEGKAKSAVLEGQSRVQSIALIHQKLYKTDDVAAVEFEPFVLDLYHQIESVFNKPGTEISFVVSARKLTVSIDAAVPLGLILNELLTNSFKYGVFPDRKNEIQIDIQPGAGPGQYVLKYRDSGPGMPENFDMKKSVSLGMKVIGLLTRQLGGKLRYYNENGTVFEIPFHAA